MILATLVAGSFPVPQDVDRLCGGCVYEDIILHQYALESIDQTDSILLVAIAKKLLDASGILDEKGFKVHSIRRISTSDHHTFQFILDDEETSVICHLILSEVQLVGIDSKIPSRPDRNPQWN